MRGIRVRRVEECKLKVEGDRKTKRAGRKR